MLFPQLIVVAAVRPAARTSLSLSRPAAIVASAAAAQPRAAVLVADPAAPGTTATDMMLTLGSQGWAVELFTSSSSASAVLATRPQAVFELEASASSLELLEACEVERRCLYRWQPASATFINSHPSPKSASCSLTPSVPCDHGCCPWSLS